MKARRRRRQNDPFNDWVQRIFLVVWGRRPARKKKRRY
jgi:hypothetical protein